jgi:hypothetical protein
MTRLTVSKFGTPGFIQDVAEYAIAPQAFNEVRNARFNSSGAQTFGGEVEVMSQAPISPLWLKAFPPLDSPIWLHADQQRVYAFDGNHNEITRLSGLYSGDIKERWHGEVLNEIGILNNTVDVPQMWTDFDASQRLVDLANWPANLRSKFLRPWKNFLFAGNLTEVGGPNAGARPFSVRWSDAAPAGEVPGSWNDADPTTLCGEVDIAATDDYLVDAKEFGRRMIVYKAKTAWAFDYIWPNNDVFAFDKILSKGLLTRDCVQDFPKGHFCVGLDDIYVHTGTENSDVSLVEARLRDWIFNQIDSSNFNYCYTYQQPRRSEIAFAFPEAGETYPTLALVWNWVTNGIGVRDLHRSPFIHPGAILVSVDDDIWGSDIVETFNLITDAGDALITSGGDHIVWS